MKRSMAAVVVVLTVGCTGSVGQSAAKSPSLTARPSSIPSPNYTAAPTLSPTPSQGADLPVSAVNFSCRLPVVRSTQGGDSATFDGGFVTLPSATLQPDPTSQIRSRYTEGDFVTDRAPVLYGIPQVGPPFYDASQHRWIPAAAAQSSPDGGSYAYATVGASSSEPAHIHVVNVGTGTEKVFNVAVPAVGAPNGVVVADFDGSGVFFLVSQVESYSSGVWRLDVATGGVKPLAQVTAVMKLHGGSAWLGRTDPHDPSPPSVPASRRLYDSIVAVNLTTGVETPWYYRPGHSVVLRGFDTVGHPIVSVSFEPDYPVDTSEIRLIDAPGTGGESNGEIVYTGGPWLSEPQADGDRLWFGSDRGIYLYTQATGLQKVFGFKVVGSAPEAMLPAGFCR